MAAAKFLVCVLVVLAAAVCVAHAQSRIKVCGRDLIRLAISFCGNSRLRRSIPDMELGQRQHSAAWDQGASLEEDQDSEMLHIPLQADGNKNDFSLAPHWYPLSFRTRRSAGKLSDICCEKGCTIKEMIQFC
ncbi:insulin-like 3 (Leydig cell) [Melanotaenia boesemani]|uniref:insulin-like 3 (Leydig cell) n=1 Tax=Melanotaenia boesemani TaxID=1250792 RepID=UPI001C03A75E|nr:insulin-like 3 (Leydig cell) [Melanotaenia boesemani]